MKRRGFVAIAFVALVALFGTGCASTMEGNGSASAPTDGTALRVASWNVDSKAHPDIKEMSSILDELDIEVMGFQEIDVNNTRNDYDMVADFVNKAVLTRL